PRLTITWAFSYNKKKEVNSIMTKKQKIFTVSAFMILAVLVLCVTIYAKNHKVANTAYAGKTVW
ncbi:hypothetical protein, partial [Syntrophaceticus schinkii]